MFIEIRGCGRNWLKLSQSLELFILLILFKENLPQFLWGQEIGVFLKIPVFLEIPRFLAPREIEAGFL